MICLACTLCEVPKRSDRRVATNFGAKIAVTTARTPGMSRVCHQEHAKCQEMMSRVSEERSSDTPLSLSYVGP